MIESYNFTPSIWNEAPYTKDKHDARTNVIDIFTRSEAQAMAHNSVGPIQKSDHQSPRTTLFPMEVTRISQRPDYSRSTYSALAKSKASYRPVEFFSANYNGFGSFENNRNYNWSSGSLINKII